MLRFNDIADRVLEYNPSCDLSLLQRAYVFSAKVHEGQERLSGEPYLVHPLEVAGIRVEMRMDEVTVGAGLLHDTIEDTLATPEELRRLFGEPVAFLVEGLTKISKIEFTSARERQAENFRKMLVAMSKDIRILLIKLADRLHNMRTLTFMSEESRRRVALETLEIYSPLAHRLGIHWVKQELEELAFRALAPQLQIIAPWREWDLGGRTQLMSYAEKWDIPISTTLKKPYSMDRNLFHISYEGGVLEDPWREPDADMFEWTKSPEEAPDTPSTLEIDFENGAPTALDGSRLDPVALLTRLNALAAEHGVGRIDIVEDRAVGMKCRGVYETPGGTVLYAAHRALESITLDREVMLERDRLSPKIAQLIYNGFWFSPEMDFLRAAVVQSQRHVNGTVRLKLYKGAVTILGRRSPDSIYSEDIATFEAGGTYDQTDATGFIKLNALRLELRKKLQLRKRDG